MQDSRLAKSVFCVLAAAAVFRFSLYYPRLPATMASHFDARGIPNGWQPKAAFFAGFLLVTALAALVALIVPRLIASVPAQYINLPNKDYWLAPERREASFEFLQTQMAWFGCALLLMIACAFYFSIQANLAPEPAFDSASFLYVLAAFLLFVMFWLIRLLARFNRPPESNFPPK
jgi:uncharacterized membrane protein